jgi:hypothetical protein
MLNISNLKEISTIKKTKNQYFTFLLLMENEEQNIILSESINVIHIHNSHTNFEEVLTITFNNKQDSNTIVFISLMNKNILVTFKDNIRCITIDKIKDSTNENKIIYSYKELFSMSLNLRGFDFYQCISLKSMENYLVSSCEKEIIHSWTTNTNINTNSNDIKYRVKKVLSVCNKDSSSYLLEIPSLKLLVSCSFKDCVLKFFDLSENFKFLRKIDNLGMGYYIGCIQLINSYLFIVASEGINGIILIDARYKEIVQRYEINGIKGWVNSIYANSLYNDLNPNNMMFCIGGTFLNDKKIISSDLQQYEIVKGEIKLVNQKNNAHEETITSLIYFKVNHLSNTENDNNKFYLLSQSKSYTKIWSNS